MSSVTWSHNSQDLPQVEGPLTDAPPFNIPHHVPPQSPLALIQEHSHTTGFTPPLSSTPYGPLEGNPPPGYPIASQSRGAPSAFMEPLSQLMHARLAVPCTPSHDKGLTLFREPYPLANPPPASTMFIHFTNVTSCNTHVTLLTNSASSEPVTFPVIPPALVPPWNSSALEAPLSQLHADSRDSQNLVPHLNSSITTTILNITISQV